MSRSLAYESDEIVCWIEENRTWTWRDRTGGIVDNEDAYESFQRHLDRPSVECPSLKMVYCWDYNTM